MNYRLSLVSIAVLICCTSCQTFYIVTSSKSHCPWEFTGEPCLTLEQYVSHPTQSSNNDITLIMEPGNHFLRVLRFSSGISATGINMIGEGSGAKIIYESPTTFYFYYQARNIQINGVSFISRFAYITISGAREFIVNNCNFQGVSFGVNAVINATFSRCTFSDYSYDFPIDFNFIFGQAGALSLDLSGVVDIIQCNFSNNKIALYGYSNYNYRHIIHIEESIFTNNTSEFEGGAVHFRIARDYVSISVNQSIFINNTAS